MKVRTPFVPLFLWAALGHAQSDLTMLNAARWTDTVAPGSIAAIFGAGLTTQTLAATSLPLPQVLGNVRVTLTSPEGVSLPADLAFISPEQVNFVVPAGAPPGIAFVSLLNGSGKPFQGNVTVQQPAPALFTADGSGKGVAAAIGIRVIDVVGPQVVFPVFSCDGSSQNCRPLPIDLGLDTPTFLALFGTGIRGATNVTVTVGGQSVPVLYAGAQGFPGLDQVNVGLPLTLRGAGLVNIVVTANGQIVSNTVQVEIQ